MDTQMFEDPELSLLRHNKDEGYNYRERRQDDWRTNYTLYRDRVIYNRLTQRQSVNVPLMKTVIKTNLKDVDDMAAMHFTSLDNDSQAEVFQNEYWRITMEENNMQIKDIVDKKQVMFFGRTFKQIQIVDGKIKITIVDPQDILVSRYLDPTNIHSSRYLIHTHIFVPISSLENNPDYDQEAVAELKEFYGTEAGLLKSAENEQSLIEKNQRMADLGLVDTDSPLLGETYVELSLHFVFRREKGEDEDQIYLYVEADGMKRLMKKPLEEVMGVTKSHYWRTHFPYNTWADDVEMQDFWSDALADIVRQPNVILNSYFSQLVENRTLRNYGMQYYDATAEGFVPQTYEPEPFGWYGLPGKPADIVQAIQIPDLSESIDEMAYITTMVEKATGATSTQQGVESQKQITLGEVKYALTEAKERVKGMSKYFIPAWEELGQMFLMVIEGGHDKLDMVKIYKKGRNSDDMYSREVMPKDWMTEAGYTVRVWSQDEKSAEETAELEKINPVKAAMSDNPVVDETFKRKLLEFANFTPDEINQALEYEKKKKEALMASMNGGMMGLPPGTGAQVPQPTQGAMA